MKIELNKIYKTRDGRKCRIICVDGNNATYPVIGLIDLGDQEVVQPYTYDGKISNNFENRADLISEYQEPKPRRLAWINKLIGHESYGEIRIVSRYLKFDTSIWERLPHLDEKEE